MAVLTHSAPPAALLSAEAAARYLAIATQTLANWRSVGRGPRYVRVGRVIRYRIQDIESWLEAGDSSQEAAR